MISSSPVNFFAIALIAAWVPLIFVLFALMPARRAVIAAFVVGYLFLPEVRFVIHTLPPIDKVTLTAFGVILGSLFFDGGRLFAVRPRWIDVPIAILCLSPIVTSILNDLGLMDGLANCFTLLFRWGLAYWIGRAYFTDWESTRELALGIVLGGLAYAPLCWWEIRMSPQLHGQIYGLLFLSFRTDRNIFGWRPNVFLANSLSVTMVMGISALLAFWAWMTGSPKRLLGVPMGWIALFLIVTAVFCKAMGGIVLMSAGITALMVTRWPATKAAVLCLILVAPVYIVLRTSGDWSGERLVDIAALVNPERGKSLDFRLQNENLLAEKAFRRMWFGFGGFGRAQIWDDYGHLLTVVDGLWIITFGEYGLVGLGALLLFVLVPALMMWYRVPTRYWTDAACAAPVALAVGITLYMIDSLFNATFNPIASLAVGAVGSMYSAATAVFSPRVARRVRLAAAAPAKVVSSVKDVPYASPAYRS